MIVAWYKQFATVNLKKSRDGTCVIPYRALIMIGQGTYTYHVTSVPQVQLHTRS